MLNSPTSTLWPIIRGKGKTATEWWGVQGFEGGCMQRPWIPPDQSWWGQNYLASGGQSLQVQGPGYQSGQDE